MYSLLRRLLFCFPTETSHHLSLASVSLIQKLGLSRLIAKPMVLSPQTVMGIEFPNSVG